MRRSFWWLVFMEWWIHAARSNFQRDKVVFRWGFDMRVRVRAVRRALRQEMEWMAAKTLHPTLALAGFGPYYLRPIFLLQAPMCPPTPPCWTTQQHSLDLNLFRPNASCFYVTHLSSNSLHTHAFLVVFLLNLCFFKYYFWHI